MENATIWNAAPFVRRIEDVYQEPFEDVLKKSIFPSKEGSSLYRGDGDWKEEGVIKTGDIWCEETESSLVSGGRVVWINEKRAETKFLDAEKLIAKNLDIAHARAEGVAVFSGCKIGHLILSLDTFARAHLLLFDGSVIDHLVVSDRGDIKKRVTDEEETPCCYPDFLIPEATSRAPQKITGRYNGDPHQQDETHPTPSYGANIQIRGDGEIRVLTIQNCQRQGFRDFPVLHEGGIKIPLFIRFSQVCEEVLPSIQETSQFLKKVEGHYGETFTEIVQKPIFPDPALQSKYIACKQPANGWIRHDGQRVLMQDCEAADWVIAGQVTWMNQERGRVRLLQASKIAADNLYIEHAIAEGDAIFSNCTISHLILHLDFFARAHLALLKGSVVKHLVLAEDKGRKEKIRNKTLHTYRHTGFLSPLESRLPIISLREKMTGRWCGVPVQEDFRTNEMLLGANVQIRGEGKIEVLSIQNFSLDWFSSFPILCEEGVEVPSFTYFSNRVNWKLPGFTWKS